MMWNTSLFLIDPQKYALFVYRFWGHRFTYFCLFYYGFWASILPTFAFFNGFWASILPTFGGFSVKKIQRSPNKNAEDPERRAGGVDLISNSEHGAPVIVGDAVGLPTSSSELRVYRGRFRV